MSPATHFLAGWLIANTVSLNRRDRITVTVASVAPDLDGAGAVAELATRHSAHPLFWFSQYHHVLHSLFFGLAMAAVAFAIARRRWVTATLALIAFHVHLLADLLGARGPDGYAWPIPYLSPLTTRIQLSWSGQWQLNAWPNFVITMALLALVGWITVQQGRSPVEVFSRKADEAVVGTMRARLRRAPASIRG